VAIRTQSPSGEKGAKRKPRRGSVARAIATHSREILSSEELVEAIGLDIEDADTLKRLSRQYIRGGQTMLGAMVARMDRVHGKPVQSHELSGNVTIQVVTGIDRTPSDEEP
jgi:hypothetical protein